MLVEMAPFINTFIIIKTMSLGRFTFYLVWLINWSSEFKQIVHEENYHNQELHYSEYCGCNKEPQLQWSKTKQTTCLMLCHSKSCTGATGLQLGSWQFCVTIWKLVGRTCPLPFFSFQNNPHSLTQVPLWPRSLLDFILQSDFPWLF